MPDDDASEAGRDRPPARMPDSLQDHDRETVGARVRARRTELGLTLQNVADRTGLSKSFLSQVEIGKAAPSVGTLEQISSVLSTSARLLVDEEQDRSVRPAAATDVPADSHGLDRSVHVVRKSGRKSLAYPGGRQPMELLTPDLQRAFEATLSVDAPGSWHEVRRPKAAHEEFALILEGSCEIEVGEVTHLLEPGDSIYFTADGAYRVRAIGPHPVRAVWIATPPAF
ncbi:helix-turn-helix domain-containing protein [Phytoactinopolyspora mesophila]|uniref:Helix-turn-helix domain-containing protein n=1 Tax=Phytoactinopolyspora mesophila TaxID=2650750 RepID=A0A7K3M555_9ACTN|nr:XRE family transcriptional regulator [Phytoactinopolyspora mesophila]NDL58376.1 helix-turn-helix domain-containing protein [Phytoactinopolyspora mesophila]